MSYQTLLLKAEGPVATISFNRPDKLNAFNTALLDELQLALTELEARQDVGVVLIKGEGRAFSVGMDIEAGYSPAELGLSADRERLQRNIEGFLRIWNFPKPVIAQVHGYCVAAASMLALACDITLVSDDCKIRFPSVPLGGGFVSTFWTFFVGPKRAKEMDFIAGSEITGAEAAEWGWANHAVPADELERRASRMAELIARTPSDLLRMKKIAINRAFEWQGFRQAALAGAEWDALCHFSDGAAQMRQRIVEVGMKEAIRDFKA